MDDKKAMNAAIAYLTAKARTETELRKRLESREFSAEVIASTLSKLKEYGYVDDQSYARQFAAEQSGRLSSRMIENKLRQRGVSRSVLECTDTGKDQDFEAALAYAQKALRSIRDPEPAKRRQRLTQRLLYRGFGYDTVNKVWSTLNLDDEFNLE